MCWVSFEPYVILNVGELDVLNKKMHACVWVCVCVCVCGCAHTYDARKVFLFLCICHTLALAMDEKCVRHHGPCPAWGYTC